MWLFANGWLVGRHKFCYHEKGTSSLVGTRAAACAIFCRPRSIDLETNPRSQGLQQAERKHGFEGEGFVYLRSPIWWAGIATCECCPSNGNPEADVLTVAASGYRRGLQLCRLRLCAGHPRDAAGSPECTHRSGPRGVLPEGGARHPGETWKRNMSYRHRHHCSACAA